MPNFLRVIVYLIVFTLPGLSNLVEHSASATLLTLTLLGIYAWATRKTKPGFEPGERLVIGAFVVYFFVCLFFYLANGLFREGASLAWDLDHELRFLAFGVILYLFHRTGLKPWTVWYGAAVAAIIYGIYSVYLYYIYGISAEDRAIGAYNAIAFCNIALAMGFISLTGLRYFHEKHPALAAVPLTALVSGILAAFLSGTRGALVAIPLLGTIFFIQLGSFRQPWRSRLALVLSVTLLSVGLYHLPGSSMDQRVRTGFTQAEAFFNGEGTGDYVVRLAMWQQAWQMFTDHPIVGWGKEGYRKNIPEKVARNEAPESIKKFDSPHNMYLTNMVAYGVTGPLVLLFIFIAPLSVLIPVTRSWGPSRDIAYAGIMHIVSFMLFAVTETIFSRNININIYMILLAAIMTLTRLYRAEV
ncbi:MAG: O-antigen ligase family protein [Desulfobacteraceae bacterium]|nr:MAG: O-antigen ligase family protein [Desulfobacteraceae bacterium]